MSKFDHLLLSAQQVLIKIVEHHLNRLNHLIPESDSDVEMVDLEFFDEPGPVGRYKKGIWHSAPFETYGSVVQSRPRYI